MKLYCEHEIPLPADDFWGVIHAPHYETKCAEAIGLEAYEELDRREEPDVIYRKIRVETELPEPLASLVRRVAGNVAPGYVEEQWRSRSKREVRWRITPKVMADRTRIEGVVRVEPKGAKRCLRILDGVVEVKVFGVGGLIERAGVAMVTDAYGKSAKVAADLPAA